MRGKDFMPGDPFENFRITPAYAGKSGAISDYIGYVKDHPRLCGEKITGVFYGAKGVGSPPPMRGKECYTNGSCAVHRITPAYAGKRRRRHRNKGQGRDHPRLCGEKPKV